MAGRGGNVEAWDGPRILRALRGGGGKVCMVMDDACPFWGQRVINCH